MPSALEDAGKILVDLKNYLDSELFELYFYLVQGAAKEPIETACGGLLKGQAIFPMHRASAELRSPRSTLYRRIDRLVDMGLVQWVRRGRCAVVSVVALAMPEPQLTSEAPKVAKKKRASKRAEFAMDAPAMRLTRTLIQYITLRLPNFKEPNLQSWAYEADLLLRVDGRAYEEADKVLRYAQRDTFWQNQILSVANLRKHFDRLLIRMQENDTLNPHRTDSSNSRAKTAGERREDKLRRAMERYT